MFGIEKLITKPIWKWMWNTPNAEGKYLKIIMGVFFSLHLLTVILLSWILYRLLRKNKKDLWNVIIPIVCLIITLVIPYSSGNEMVDFILNEFYPSFLIKLGTFFAYTSLLMGIACLVLHFFDIKISKSENQERDEDNKEQ